jgi:preprotein translocase subunit SecE
MALNREQKRMLQRQGELGPDGEPLRTKRGPQGQRPKEQRTSPRQFAKEVRGELRKVAWPTRSETINYSIITLITLVVATLLIFGIDWVFSELVLRLFNAK